MPQPRRSRTDGPMPAGIRAWPAREISGQIASTAGAAEALARQIRALDTLRRAASQLVAHRALPEVFEELLALLFAAVPAERGAILLLEDGELRTRAWRGQAGQGPPVVSRSIAGRVLQDRVALLLDNALADPRFSAAQSIAAWGVRSALCAPLWLLSGDEEQAVGLVYLDSSRFTHAFDEDDLGLVTAIANVAAAKIQNVRLLEDSLEKRRLERELHLAARLQAELLPAAPPRLPGWDVAAWTTPCYAVGGDYYDWEARDGGVRLALGDVAGKGTSAALLTAALRALVRTCWGERDLAAGAAWLNGALLDTVPAGRYATLFLARLEPERGGLSFVNAGHVPPLLVRRDGRAATLSTGGIPLGLLPGARFQAGFARLDPGDSLLVFSDGLPEAQDGAGEELGVERLLGIVAAERGDAGALARRVEREVAAFSGSGCVGDDRTLMVVTRQAP